MAGKDVPGCKKLLYVFHDAPPENRSFHTNEKTARWKYQIMAALDTYSPLSRITSPFQEAFSIPTHYESTIIYQKRNSKTMHFFNYSVLRLETEAEVYPIFVNHDSGKRGTAAAARQRPLVEREISATTPRSPNCRRRAFASP
jgi:hypothetical protein